MEEQEKKPTTRRKTATKQAETRTTSATKQTTNTTKTTTKRKVTSTTKPKETKEKDVDNAQSKKFKQATNSPSKKPTNKKNVETKEDTEGKGVEQTPNEVQEKKPFNFYKLFTIVFACIIGLGLLIPSIISIVGTVSFNNIKNRFKDELVNDNTWVASAFANSEDAQSLNVTYNYTYISDLKIINYNNTDYMVFELFLNLNYLDGQPIYAYRSNEYFLSILYKASFVEDLEFAMRQQLANNHIDGFPLENCQIAVSYNGDYYKSKVENQIETTKEIRQRVYSQTQQIVAKKLKYPSLAIYPEFEEFASSDYGNYYISYVAKDLYFVYGYVNATNAYGQYSNIYYSCLIESFEYSYYEALFLTY